VKLTIYQNLISLPNYNYNYNSKLCCAKGGNNIKKSQLLPFELFTFKEEFSPMLNITLAKEPII
jgi:hypothetical protein